MDRDLEDILAEYDAAAPLAESWTIPGPWYTDPRVAERERRTVWSRTWQMVARADQVEHPGHYVTAEVAGEPIVLVPPAAALLPPFFNVCRHHAAAVMTEPEGRAERLACPYHGWTYALDGQLKSTPELDGICGFDRARNGLVPVAVAAWEKLVFVHLDPDPPPLAAHLREMA